MRQEGVQFPLSIFDFGSGELRRRVRTFLMNYLREDGREQERVGLALRKMFGEELGDYETVDELTLT